MELQVNKYGGPAHGYVDEPWEGFNGEGFESGEYTGFDDDDITFGADGDGLSFPTALAANKVFTVNITNSYTVPKTISFSACMWPVAGTTQLAEGDNLVDPGDATKKVTCQGVPFSYNFWKKWLEWYPTSLIAIKIQSTFETQLSQMFMETKVDPYQQMGSKPIAVGSYTRPNDPNTKMVTLSGLHLQLDNKTDLSISIPAGATSIFSFYVGGEYNIADGLRKRKKRAMGSTVAKQQLAAANSRV